ncbi:MAG TPA: glycosyltransferase family 9 protein [Tepidisphaeraceae bacterium]|nr:glycosyltransferase family 9 protein [Tepidisphaeraceae bacterium]
MSSTPSPFHSPPRHVLVPIVAGIGNALMAVPMVRQMKRAVPGARITILARTEPMAEVFRRLNEVDEVLVTGAGWKGHWRSVIWSRQRRPDVYVVPFPSNRWQYSMLAATGGARRRVLHGYPVGYWRALHFLPSTRVPARRGIHDVVQNLNLLRDMNIEPDVTEAPSFRVNEADRVRADELLKAAGAPARGEPFIVVHAGSARTVLARAKRWPVQNYAQLIAAMSRELQLPIVLLEGPDEMGVAHEIELHLPPGEPPVTPCALRGPLGDAAAVLERATLYVGSDSGLAHLAAAVGTRAVTLFGPADPDRVSPFGQRDLVVQAPKNCGPCFLYPWHTPYPKIRCREPYCIDSVTVESVMAAVRRGMAEAEASAGTARLRLSSSG